MSKKAKTKKAVSQGRAKGQAKKTRKFEPAMESQASQAPATDAAEERKPRERDPRLPPPGTVIQKFDRHGAVRCECSVEDGGIRYNGTLYRSLSAAALVATKDLGTPMRSVNGFAWWGIVKPARRTGDPLAALDRAWERYRGNAAFLVEKGVTDDNRDAVRAAIEKHAATIAELAEALR